MCCHYPVKSLAWQGGVSHHELITLHYSSEVTLKFWAFLNHRLIFFGGGGGYNLFNLRFMRYIISHSLVSNCQYVPLKDSIHCKKIKRKKRKTVQKSWKSNENVHLQSPVNLLSGFWVFNFHSDNSTGVSQITLCQCSFYWKQLVRSTTEACLISLALKLIYWKRGIFDYQL